MADFCNVCGFTNFGIDGVGDLAGITTQEDWSAGFACWAICEGCGLTQVDPEGNCIREDCLEKHGLTYNVKTPDAG